MSGETGSDAFEFLYQRGDQSHSVLRLPLCAGWLNRATGGMGDPR